MIKFNIYSERCICTKHLKTQQLLNTCDKLLLIIELVAKNRRKVELDSSEVIKISVGEEKKKIKHHC